MAKRKYSKSFETALSAISCAFAVIGLLLGFWTGGLLTATGYLIGVIALMVPLSKQFFVGDALAYLGTCLLAVVLGAAAKFWDIVPFIMFFGLHPLVNALQVKFNVNKWLALLVKTVWFDCTLIAAYFLIFGGVFFGTVLPESWYEFIDKNIYIFIFTVGSVIFFIYDYLIFKCQIVVNRLVYIIKK